MILMNLIKVHIYNKVYDVFEVEVKRYHLSVYPTPVSDA